MPKPILQAMVLAEHVYQDKFTGKFVIAGTFARIYFRTHTPAPVEPPQDAAPLPEGQHYVSMAQVQKMGTPYLYLALAEVYGEVALALRFVNLDDSTTHFEAQLLLGSTNPALIAEYKIPLPEFPATTAGAYSLDLYYENELLGGWRVSVIDANAEESGEMPI